ncbi:ABC transporter permease [Paenibacillus sp. BC26]|uniref:ABC transporter permease n=1 Tax=Paenibacillus sp. BC26 TaxID=1881032 RepID=UPI0008E04623|nr:ABC transporter permease subunit [Paenibacillus sp. BC26]SFT27910.1 ABC-type transport system involved in multi-copper enzyme maturation, permease component [Paenibacillus sp. BC26]
MMWISYAGKELFRKKIWIVSMVLTVLFVGLFCYGLSQIASHTQGELVPAQALMNGLSFLTLGLIFSQMIIAFLVLFSTMGVISGEVESGLMLAVLARPIPRWKVYLGRYAGIAGWLLIYSILLFLAILLPVHYWLDYPLDVPSALKALLYFVWAPQLLLAVTLLGSIYLPMLGNGVACAMLYGLSLFSGFAENLYAIQGTGANQTASQLSLFISMLMPSNAMLRRITYELFSGLNLPVTTDMIQSLGPFSAINVPSAAFIGYTVIYFILLLGLGCAAFRRKDIA